MNEQWTFPELEYKRPDYDAIREELKTLTEKAQSAASAKELLDVIEQADKLQQEMATMITIVGIRHTLDTADEFYEKENEFTDETLPTLMPDMVAFQQALAESAHRPEVEEKIGKQYFVYIDLEKKKFCEENIPLMQQEAKLCDEYQKIMASCQIEFDGEKRNLYGIQKYFEHTDRDVRRRAFNAWSAFYHDNEPRLEEIWDELIRIRNEMGRNLGFENYIPLGYLNQGRTDYGQAEVEKFRQQVRDVIVPLCSELYEAQAQRLGIEHVMSYDEKMVFPEGNAVPAGDDDYMIEQARRMYHDMSSETGEFIDFMIDHQLMDLKNKPGKASTGYMTDLPVYRAPYVFSCFNQTIFDMQVLSHELGHAFAGYMAMRSQPLSDYYSESTDIAEIHSMAMEQFAYPYAEQFFGDQADKFRFAHLQEALTFVPFGTAVDEFQHICYEHPELTPKERTMQWHHLEEVYMPWRRYEDDEFMERGGYWYHKLHIYLYPFYYINYTFTTIGAMEFKKKASEDAARAWEDYLALCRVGGSKSYLETLKLAELSVPYEEGTVKRVIEYPAKILREKLSKMEKD